MALRIYCERIIGDIDEIIHENEKDTYDRYNKIYRAIQDGDKKLSRMFDGFSRSKASLQLAMYYNSELVSDKEIAQLSKQTRDKIYNLIEMGNG